MTGSISLVNIHNRHFSISFFFWIHPACFRQDTSFFLLPHIVVLVWRSCRKLPLTWNRNRRVLFSKTMGGFCVTLRIRRVRDLGHWFSGGRGSNTCVWLSWTKTSPPDSRKHTAETNGTQWWYIPMYVPPDQNPRTRRALVRAVG